jgi:hypothetical protein
MYNGSTSGRIMTYQDTKCFRLGFTSLELNMKLSQRIGRCLVSVQQKARHLSDAGPVLGSEQEPLAQLSGDMAPWRSGGSL